MDELLELDKMYEVKKMTKSTCLREVPFPQDLINLIEGSDVIYHKGDSKFRKVPISAITIIENEDFFCVKAYNEYFGEWIDIADFKSPYYSAQYANFACCYAGVSEYSLFTKEEIK